MKRKAAENKGREQMTRKKSQPPKVVDIIEDVNEKISYDCSVLDKFLTLVFGEQLEVNEFIPCWNTRTTTGLPNVDGDLLDKLATETSQLSIFTGTSTLDVDAGDNRIYNRPDLFRKQYLVTMDVKRNTKIPVELAPTYSIEIGPDKQYGYVFEEPIDNYETALAFCRVLAGSKYFEVGIPSPQRIIRLPGGVRGGIGREKLYRVKLEFANGPIWTPEDLLKALDLGVPYQKLQKSPLRAIQEIRGGRYGTAPFLSRQPHIMSLNGEIDPVTEWLFAEKMIVGHKNDCLQIICPWSDKHKNISEIADYTPIGNSTNPEERAFSCQDPACQTFNIEKFLIEIFKMGGPLEPVEDVTPSLVSEYAYDMKDNLVWSVKGEMAARYYTTQAFSNANPKSIPLPKGKKTPKASTAATKWKNSKYRLLVFGRTFAPHTNAKIVNSYERELVVNQFCLPVWGDGEFDMKQVEKFKEFIRYLIPAKKERIYFYNWLACKAQNMGFRGVALIMIAKKQGTGRNTLASMIASVFSPYNVQNVSFRDITGEQNSQYNEWAESPIVVTDETLSGSNKKGFKMAYERIKESVDTSPKTIRINPKYGQHRISTIHSSFMFMSNHENAIAITEDDRRFYVITNALHPESPQYFKHLNDWTDKKDKFGRPAWAKHVWRWLRVRPVNVEMMLAPPEKTSGKKKMLTASQSRLELAIDGIIHAYKGRFITTDFFKLALKQMTRVSGIKNVDNVRTEIGVLVDERTAVVNDGKAIKVNNKPQTIRIILERVDNKEAERLTRVLLSKKQRTGVRLEIMESLEPEEWKKLLDKAISYVQEHLF